MEHRNNVNFPLFIQLSKVQDMFQKHRLDLNIQKMPMKFCKKFDNYVTNPTTKNVFHENQSY